MTQAKPGDEPTETRTARQGKSTETPFQKFERLASKIVRLPKDQAAKSKQKQ